MDKTPHVMLAGSGALQFALENGFERENLLTPKMKKVWQKWAKEKHYDPKINWENEPNKYHDTIGLLAIDGNSQMAGACTTSGMGGKIRGRVGDSPIIGAGLFVDNEIGSATATGMGELVMKTLGSFLVVEFMRNGSSPQEACEKAILRIVQKVPDHKKFQIGFIALNKNGDYGAYSLQPGFQYALSSNGQSQLLDSDSYFSPKKP
jgi:isoaspartyl peptidase/L-asparaginase-like protein (Ntn-hydrolase superfamily)